MTGGVLGNMAYLPGRSLEKERMHERIRDFDGGAASERQRQRNRMSLAQRNVTMKRKQTKKKKKKKLGGNSTGGRGSDLEVGTVRACVRA